MMIQYGCRSVTLARSHTDSAVLTSSTRSPGDRCPALELYGDVARVRDGPEFILSRGGRTTDFSRSGLDQANLGSHVRPRKLPADCVAWLAIQSAVIHSASMEPHSNIA